MRHRKKGRRLGRSSSHRLAMFRNMASSLFLSQREAEVNEAGEEYREYDTPADGRNIPKVPGRIVTTLQKAKTLRPLIEKCITIACKGLEAEEAANEFGTQAERHTSAWKQWRQGENWNRWAQAMAPAIVARRRVLRMVGNKRAMEVLFSTVAPRFRDRPGGYTRIVRLATPRLGDAGTRAILELVGTHDRVRQKSEKPAFDDDGEAGESKKKEAAGAKG
jgi:large subunit ribosomal protein L17